MWPLRWSILQSFGFAYPVCVIRFEYTKRMWWCFFRLLQLGIVFALNVPSFDLCFAYTGLRGSQVTRSNAFNFLLFCVNSLLLFRLCGSFFELKKAAFRYTCINSHWVTRSHVSSFHSLSFCVFFFFFAYKKKKSTWVILRAGVTVLCVHTLFSRQKPLIRFLTYVLMIGRFRIWICVVVYVLGLNPGLFSCKMEI